MVVDLFPDPIIVKIGGNEFTPAPTRFPYEIEQPATYTAATVTPWPDIVSTIFAPCSEGDLIATLFLGVALALGPDFILAPSGLVSNEGIRPGYALEAVVGELVTPDAQWLKDRKEKLAATAPPLVRLLVLLPFLAAGLLLSRLLLVTLEDPSFVISIGIISCLGGATVEVIRQPLPTRAERDLRATLYDDFLLFSSERLELGGRCHEREVVAAFRRFYPRYRYADMARSADGVSVADDDIADRLREWNARMGRPAQRTSSGFWKGIRVLSGARHSAGRELG